jgi:hypothetical protein
VLGVARPATPSTARLPHRRGVSPAAVTTCATPSPASPSVMIQRWSRPSRASALIVCDTALNPGGWASWAATHPPISSTGAAHEEAIAHHGGRVMGSILTGECSRVHTVVVPNPPRTVDELRARARRGQRLGQLLFVPLFTLGGPIWGYYGLRHRYDSFGGTVFPSVLGACTGLGIVLLATRRRRADPASLYSPMLVLGLPLLQRRAVRRTIRRGEPAYDPLLRLAADDSARRAVRTVSLTVFVTGLGTIFFAGVTTYHDLTALGHVTAAVIAGLALGWLVWSLHFYRCARRYLALTGQV